MTTNLFKGLINIATWKIMCSIFAVLLLKLMTTPQVSGADNFLTSAIVNLCVGIGMLFVPFATKSWIGDGMTGVANMAAGFTSGLLAKLTYGKVWRWAKRDFKHASLKIMAAKTGQASHEISKNQPMKQNNTKAVGAFNFESIRARSFK